MVKRQGGLRRKTRHTLKKPIRAKGKVSITRTLQSFETGDKVLLLCEPAIQNGMYHRRFHGKVGKVKAKRGECYEVSVRVGTTDKVALIAPVHLRKL